MARHRHRHRQHRQKQWHKFGLIGFIGCRTMQFSSILFALFVLITNIMKIIQIFTAANWESIRRAGLIGDALWSPFLSIIGSIALTLIINAISYYNTLLYVKYCLSNTNFYIHIRPIVICNNTTQGETKMNDKKGMKSVVLDSEGMIWGTGATDEEALHDAYKWLNQDSIYSSYDDFVESKCYESLTVDYITDDAYDLVQSRGGDYVNQRDGVFAHHDRVVMTRAEWEMYE